MSLNYASHKNGISLIVVDSPPTMTQNFSVLSKIVLVVVLVRGKFVKGYVTVSWI